MEPRPEATSGARQTELGHFGDGPSRSWEEVLRELNRPRTAAEHDAAVAATERDSSPAHYHPTEAEPEADDDADDH